MVSTALTQGEEGVLSGTLRQAIDDAMPRLREGDTLLLSPGCASWDQFTDYRERGNAFAAEVARHGTRSADR